MKQPTCTCRVFEFLVRSDDFKSVAEIQLGTGCAYNQVTAALSHLFRRKAVGTETGIVPSPLGPVKRGFWFATPETDTRNFHVDEREPEKRPRTRKVKKKKKKI